MAWRGAGVAHDVGQRLLDDAVGGQVDAGGQAVGDASPRRPALAVDALDPHVEAGAARAVDQAVEVGQAGGGGQRGGLALAQQVEHRAQLAEGLLAGVLDGGERRADLAALPSGCSSTRCSATPACTLMSEMLWASTSCSSRAMRSRSSLARRRASSARTAARSSSSRISSRRCSIRLRASSLAAASTSSQAPSPPTSDQSGHGPSSNAGITHATTT